MNELNSKYFKLAEFTKSEIAKKYNIDNTPSDKVIENLQWLVLKILDPLRNKLGKPVIVTSGYRCKELNEHKEVGGSKNSQHLEGKASDIRAIGMTTKELFEFIINETKLPFDQVINEFDSWIHISYDRDKPIQRGQIKIAKKVNGKTIYEEIG